MAIRYFTIEEANSLLSEIRPLMAELLERRARVVDARPALEGILDDTSSNVGSRKASAATQDFMAIEQLVEKIRAYGCDLKDVNVGLVDFLAEIDGREVYLCWRFGEEKIQFYHDLHSGFQGRRRLE